MNWINVKDRLPEMQPEWNDEFAQVLVCTGAGRMFVDTFSPNGFFHDGNLRISNRTKDQKHRYITHWMPLPELPECFERQPEKYTGHQPSNPPRDKGKPPTNADGAKKPVPR